MSTGVDAGDAAKATVTGRRSGPRSPLTEREERALERDADGFMTFDGFVRLPCTGVLPGGTACDVIPYVPVDTDPAVALCQACTNTRAKEAKMAAKKKKTNGASTTTKGKTNAQGHDEPVERKRFAEEVPVKIPADKVEEKAAEMARVTFEEAEVLSDKREANSEYREKLAALRKLRLDLAKSVQEHTEQRSVQCVEQFLPRTNEIQVVRLDTGEILRTRAATAEDRQEDLPGLDLDEGTASQPQPTA